jgi:protein TonB
MALTETGTATAGDRGLWLAIGVSLLLHAVALSLHFTFPDTSRTLRNKALDIVLVNARSERKPTDPQVLAQTNLDGGGNREDDVRAATPLPPSPREQTGNDLEETQKRAQALETQQRNLLAQARKSRQMSPPPEDAPSSPEPTPSPTPEPPVLNGRELASSALEMTRLEAQIARQSTEYNQRPRVKNIGTRAEEYRFAQYMEDWRNKVERIGTLNYPEAARGRLSGSLMMTVYIRGDGNVERVEIDRPSGHSVLDEAARRIVRMASPFAEFPTAIRRDTDILSITRTWTFTSSNQLQTR